MTARHRPLAAAALTLVMALACRPALAPVPEGTPPDVVLIVMDTVRPDRLSLYGHDRPTSPRLEALATESRTFDQARSTSTWTSPAHASMFTGLYPGAHGTTQESWTLPDSLSTLAEILGERGYTTAAVSGNPMLTEERGFAQGFDDYRQTWWGPTARTDLRSFAEIEELIETLPSPYFLFVNLIGAHSPYDSCGPECERFTADPFKSPRTNQWLDFYRGRVVHSDEDLERLTALYDAELRRADTIVGKIVDDLRSRGRIDETLLVVTSDHGENLGDHGHIDHLFSLYDSTVRVPLLIRHPERFEPGSRSQALVQLPDLFPTILSAAGVPEDEIESQGIDVANESALEGRPNILEYYDPVQAMSVVYERSSEEEKRKLDPYDRKLEAIVIGNHKLVRGSDGSAELYDLAVDPEERENLAERAEQQAVRRGLEASLDRWLARYRKDSAEPVEHAPVSEETRRALEAIGYIE
jgi:arylsulfatase A-like enzyme